MTEETRAKIEAQAKIIDDEAVRLEADQAAAIKAAPVQAVAPADATSTVTAIGNVWTDPQAFNRALRVSDMLSKSSLVPQSYQGKPQDCFIALEMATRLNTSPIFVMQNLYVVKGKPSWSGQACFGMIMACGRFASVKLEYSGTEGADDWGCRVTALRLSDGERVSGTTVTIGMAKAEGWMSNPKWKNMPQQMLGYRAASFFARHYCPDALLGLQTYEEILDTDMRPEGASSLTDALKAEAAGEGGV